jgi:hypothetical protein
MGAAVESLSVPGSGTPNYSSKRSQTLNARGDDRLADEACRTSVPVGFGVPTAVHAYGKCGITRSFGAAGSSCAFTACQ